MKVSGLDENELAAISDTLARFFPNKIIPANAYQPLIHLMKADKKSAAGKMKLALIRKTGEPVIQPDVSPQLLLESFHYYNSIIK